MPQGYGIDSLGMNNLTPADTAFIRQNLTNNPYYIDSLAAQQQAAQLAALEKAALADTTRTTGGNAVTFQGGEQAQTTGKGGKVTPWVIGGVVSAGTLLYAAKRGNGKGVVQGFKNILNSFGKSGATDDVAESVTKKISNLIKDGGKGLKECKIKNGKDIITIKNGVVTEVATQTEKKVSTGVGSRLSSVSPTTKGVEFNRFERVVKANDGKEYRVFLDKDGNVLKAFKGRTGKTEINVDDVEGLLDRAQTYTHTFNGHKFRKPERGGFTRTNMDVELSVNNGEIVKAAYRDSRGWHEMTLDDDVLKVLKEDFGTEIPKFGKYKKGFGVKPEECIYEYTNPAGTKRWLFNADSKITEAFDIKTTPQTSTKKVSEYLEKHGMQDIIKTGDLPEGAIISNATFESAAGNIYTIKNGKIDSIKLKEACSFKNGKGRWQRFTAGETISDKNRIESWQRGLAANNGDYDAVLQML